MSGTEQLQQEDSFLDQEVVISKLDAARSHLESAAYLFFHGQNAASIHTLTAAAYTIIQDVNRSRSGLPMLVKDGIKLLVAPDRRKAVHKRLNEAEKFLKHANQDPAGTLTFHPVITWFMILDASVTYHEMTGDTPALLNHFLWWLMLTLPDLILWPTQVRPLVLATAPAIRSLPCSAFLELLESFSVPLPNAFGPKTHAGVAEFIERVRQVAKGRPRHDDRDDHVERSDNSPGGDT